MSTRNTVSAITVNGTTITQIKSSRINSNIELFKNKAGGIADPTFNAVKKWAPVASITSTALKALLDIAGINGLAISASFVAIYLSKMTQGSAARSTGADHECWTIKSGLIIPRRISASQEQGGGSSEAEITYDIIATWDGTNAPLILSAASLPATSGIASQKYTLGPLDYAGVMYGVANLDFDFGLKEWVDGQDGQPYPNYACIMDRDPVVTVKTRDVHDVSAVIDAAGEAFTDARVWFKEIPKGGSRTADATAQHIKIGMTQGVAFWSDVEASQGGAAEQTVMIHPSWDGTNAIANINTAAAISVV